MVITKQMWADLNAKIDGLSTEPRDYFSAKDATRAYRIATESVEDPCHPHSPLYCVIQKAVMSAAKMGLRTAKVSNKDTEALEKECEVFRSKGFAAGVTRVTVGRNERVCASYIEVSW